MGIGRLNSGRKTRPVRGALSLVVSGLAVVALLLTSCESPLRTAVKTLTGAYTSINDERAIYVDAASGDDANPGTRDLPKKTIQAGIDFVISFLGTGTVKVKNGTYLQTDKLVIKQGASIEGGYNANWVQEDLVGGETQTIVKGRDAANGADAIVTAQTDPGVTSSTVITGVSFETGIGYDSMTLVVKNASPLFKDCIVSGNGGVGETIAVAVMTQSGFAQGSAPVFDGCLIEGGTTIGDTYAVQAVGDTTATFKYCVIAPGSSQSGSSYGIFVSGCEVNVQYGCVVGTTASAATAGCFAIGVYGKNGILDLEGCSVMGGYVGDNTTGVYCDNCEGYIRNATIYGGKGASTSIGVRLIGTDMPYVRNCTINGGASAAAAYGIYGQASGAIIENCLVWTETIATRKIAVAMAGDGAEVFPSALNNCDLFNAQYCYGYSTDKGANFSAFNIGSAGIAGMQARLAGSGGTSSSNVYEPSPGFVSTTLEIDGSNWALTSSSPSTITAGGKNFSSLFTEDKTGSDRPASNWSIGAYQYP